METFLILYQDTNTKQFCVEKIDAETFGDAENNFSKRATETGDINFNIIQITLGT